MSERSDIRDVDSVAMDADQSAVATLTLGGDPLEALRVTPSLQHLPEFQLADASSPEVDLQWLDSLGEGGMGVVSLARQTSLQREVAVKTVVDGASDAVVESLLQEAYITGFLEHPNIVPIYTAGRSADGQPLIVMKRISGTVWSDLLEEQWSDGPPDLEPHLDILLQITRAVRFAHSKDVVHRDIKADNVMIGDYGEVYLLDWGIACCLRGDRPLLPHIDEGQGTCGTPGYMAPEMTPFYDAPIDAHTDTYLLGATLHFILCGQTRHRGHSIPEFLQVAARSEPHEYPESTPLELAAIANKACHSDPAQRFQSAREFEDALTDYQRHRESVLLSETADDKRHLLKLRLHADHSDVATIQNLFGECRFGYNEALRIWQDNERALQGLRSCLTMMAHHHLDRRQLDAARACVEDLPEPNEELQERLEQLEDKLQSEQADVARLKQMEEELDVTTASSSRSLLMVIFGTVWTATSLFGALQHGPTASIPTSELGSYATSGLRNMLIAFVGVLAFRKQLLTNAANRRLVYLLLTFVSAITLLRAATWLVESGYFISRIGEFLIAGVLMIAIGLVSDLRICAFALLFVALSAFAIIWPEYHLLARPIAIGATFFGFAWLWTPRQVKKRIEFNSA